jgi:hypothetical protein
MREFPKRIFIGFLIYSSISLMVSVVSFELFRRMESTEQLTSYANTLFNKTVHAIKLGQDFMLYEIYQDDFFQTGHSYSLTKYERLLKDIDTLHIKIATLKNIQKKELVTEVRHLDKLMNKYDSIFRLIVQKEIQRGYKEYGMEGKMRRNITELETHPVVSTEKILQMRKYEKDYLLRKDTFYITNLRAVYVSLEQDLSINTKLHELERQHLREALSNYMSAFLQIATIEREIGHSINDKAGLSSQLKVIVDEVDVTVDKINVLLISQKERINATIKVVFLSIITVSVLLILLMAIAFKAVIG